MPVHDVPLQDDGWKISLLAFRKMTLSSVFDTMNITSGVKNLHLKWERCFRSGIGMHIIAVSSTLKKPRLLVLHLGISITFQTPAVFGRVWHPIPIYIFLNTYHQLYFILNNWSQCKIIYK